jgi:hypothetical protein
MWQSQIGAVREGTKRVERFNGDIWYVDGVSGDDSDTGFSPDASLKTLAVALTKAANGDAISIAIGTYNENGLEVIQDGLHIWAQRGTTLIDTLGGIQTLLISGDNCVIDRLNIAQAGQIGLNITGLGCLFTEGFVLGATVGIDINGPGCIVERSGCSGYTVTGVDISSPSNALISVGCTGSGGATRGVYLSNTAADNNILRGVYSSGNGTSSIDMVPGCTGNTVFESSSGAGDGRWSNGDNVWSLDYADEVYHTTVFDGSGPGVDNLFSITGTVEIDWIFGDVETALSVDIGSVYLETSDGPVQNVITKSVGPTANSLGVGSTLLKTADAATNITILNSNQGEFQENTANKPKASFIVQEKSGVSTYIRLVYAGVATSGSIHWHCRFIPLTENGWLVPV